MTAAHPTLDFGNSEFGLVFGHAPLDTEALPGMHYHSSHNAGGVSNDAVTVMWDGMMNDICAAPVLPSLDSNNTHKGTAATVQNFYEGRPSCKCCINWVEKQPEKVPDEAQQKYDGVAIRIYHGKNHSKETLGGLKTVSPISLIIQSPVILKVLDPIFKEIGGPLPMNGLLQVASPFAEFFFAYPKILDAYNECELDSEEKSHLRVLKEVLDELLREVTAEVKDLHGKNLITYEYLWTLFPKGILVVSKSGIHEYLLEVVSYNISSATLNCRHVAFDGFQYGMKQRNIVQAVFWGARPISELCFYPLSFHKNREQLEKNIILRSRRVLGYQKMVHGEYEQNEAVNSKRRSTKPSPMRERIIVDPYGSRVLGEFATSLTRLTSEHAALDEELRFYFENAPSKGRPSLNRIQKNMEYVSMKPHWLLLLDPFVAGYSLRTREFSTFYVDGIHEVRWNDWAYENVVFHEKSKEDLSLLVKNHGSMKEISSDVIPGKGNGLVVLLSGPPGTGKTLTAEAIAEQARCPFLRIQAETLGKFTEDLEIDLERSFKLATEWNALLLIDEADAYLGNNGLQKLLEDSDEYSSASGRSSLVRTLMTQLEYYSGVLFLTTNFPEKIDEAFSSRIDVHLKFPALDRNSRCQLLRNMVHFANSSSAFKRPADLSEEDYWNLARWELNGRELKNAIKVSSRLCSIKEELPSCQGLETAMRYTAPQKMIERGPALQSRKRARST